ncbi:MAG: hypothetical protein RDU89_03920 [bacterium]|nr:hypothetical protein [bacterium]
MPWEGSDAGRTTGGVHHEWSYLKKGAIAEVQALLFVVAAIILYLLAYRVYATFLPTRSGNWIRAA